LESIPYREFEEFLKSSYLGNIRKNNIGH
jgi:hypothetical protein